MADDPVQVNEAIDGIFEAALVESERSVSDDRFRAWTLDGIGLDPRVRTYDPFSVPHSIENEAPYFNAGAQNVAARG
jgi:hypothetical protein